MDAGIGCWHLTIVILESDQAVESEIYADGR